MAEADFEVLTLRPVERKKLVGHEYSVETLRIMALEGDSMEPKLHDGEEILFNMGEDVPHGGIAVVVWRWKWFVRGVLWGKDHSVTLRASNPNYQDIHIEAGDEEFHIIGRVVGGLGSFRATPSIFSRAPTAPKTPAFVVAGAINLQTARLLPDKVGSKAARGAAWG